MQKRLVENYGKKETESIRNRIKNMSHGELLTIYLHNDEIVKTIYGSGDGTEDLESLLNKTESDINFYLSKQSAKILNKRRRK